MGHVITRGCHAVCVEAVRHRRSAVGRSIFPTSMSAPGAAVMARDGVGELAELLATQPTDWEATFWAMDCAKITATESVSTADGATSVSSIARVKLCGVLPWGGVTSSRHYDAAGTAFTGRGSHYTHRTIGTLTDFDPVAKRATYRVQVQHGSRTYDAATYSECIGRATASDDHNPSLSRVPCHLSVCAAYDFAAQTILVKVKRSVTYTLRPQQ